MTISTALGTLPDLENIQQHEQVQDADDPQEDARDARTHDAADVLQPRELLLDRCGSERNGDSQCKHDRRVAEREKEPYAQRALAFLQHVTDGIVHGGYMICIE